MLSAILRVQLTKPLGDSLDSFERHLHAYEDPSGKPTPDEILAATVFAGIDNATVAQLLALDDGESTQAHIQRSCMQSDHS